VFGDTTNIKPGDRTRLQGKKAKSKGCDKTLVWETRKVTKDFGVFGMGLTARPLAET
jgi:hypothetical protein